MKKLLALAMGIFMVFSFGACRKKEEKLPQVTPPAVQAPMLPQMKAEPETPITQPQIPGHGTSGMGPRSEAKIVIPDTVKGKWSKVKIILHDKSTNNVQELAIGLNSETKIPDSGLRIDVSDFIPDFRMNGTITSATNEPNNPAVHIKIYEGDKEIFKGWLFSKFPDVHPFDHPRYSLILKEGIKKG